jgi:hypothetical protein
VPPSVHAVRSREAARLPASAAAGVLALPPATNTAAAASRTVVPMLAGRRMPATVDTPAVKHARGRGLRTPCRVCGVSREGRESYREPVAQQRRCVCVSLSPAVQTESVLWKLL